MKKIDKLLFCLGLFLSLSIAGCAATPRVQSKLAADPIKLGCEQSCKLIGECNGRSSDHEILMCRSRCFSTHPIPRGAIIDCSKKWLKKCNHEAMNVCVEKKIAPYQNK
jgi:hypothetical protein